MEKNLEQRLSPREELIKIQEDRIKIIKEELERTYDFEDQTIKKYKKSLEKRTKRYKEEVNKEDLLRDILNPDIIYIEDFHTNKQYQKTLIRIFREVKDFLRKPIIALECIESKDQKTLDNYLKGDVSEKDFTKKIKYNNWNWMFSWRNQGIIIKYAKKHRIPIIAINKSLNERNSLQKRDKHAAKIIAKCALQNKYSQIFVVNGGFHQTPDHLPLEVDRELGDNKRKKLILYQNSDDIYFQLAKKGLEQNVDCVRISKEEYCLINTTPVMKWQSVLNWYEMESEVNINKINGWGGNKDIPDLTNRVIDITRKIAEFLNVKTKIDENTISVYSSSDFDYLKKVLMDKNISTNQRKEAIDSIKEWGGHYLDGHKTLYLTNMSLNHIGEEATHFLNDICSGGVVMPNNSFDEFYVRTMKEAIGYFGSKIINHKRKTFNKDDIKHTAINGKNKDKEIASLLSQHLDFEDKWHSGNVKKSDIPTQMYSLERKEKQFAYHVLGYMLGEEIHKAIISEKLKKEYIKKLFQNPFKKEHEAFNIYMQFSKKLKKI